MRLLCGTALVFVCLTGCNSQSQQPSSVDTTLPDETAAVGRVTPEASELNGQAGSGVINERVNKERNFSSATRGSASSRRNLNLDDDLDYEEQEIEEPAVIAAARPDPVPKGNPGNWANTNDYPSRALQQEREGTVGFRVTIGSDGRVIDCQIVSSSGHEDLDQATCTNLRRRARFDPALDDSGRPITGTYSNRVRWQIPK